MKCQYLVYGKSKTIISNCCLLFSWHASINSLGEPDDILFVEREREREREREIEREIDRDRERERE